MRLNLAVVLAIFALAAPAAAADYVAVFKTPSGEPVADAVVTIHPAAGGAALRIEGPYTVAQRNIAFDPFVVVVPVGADVGFPNKDAVRHHVYSFSAAHPFELKLYGKDETRRVKFDRAGIVALGCNIHDQMIGYVDVVDTPYAVKTDAKGEAHISGVPAGPATIAVWHPYLKTPQNRIEWKAVIGGVVPPPPALDVRRPPEKHH
jgi:plastocyanin